MTKRTVMGVHAPPPRSTHALKGFLGGTLLLVIILLGLAFDPVIYAILQGG